MEEYRPIPFQEVMDRMSEGDRQEIEEGSKRILEEEEFWANLPEPERNKRLERPKASYDVDTDILWLKNGRPTPRSCEIVKGEITAFFESTIWYPSAVKIVRAYGLLGEFLLPNLCKASGSMQVRYGEDGAVERSLKLENLEVRYESLSDYLWLGNGQEPWDGAEIAEDLVVSYAEDSRIPVGIGFFRAAEIIAPVLASAHPSSAGV